MNEPRQYEQVRLRQDVDGWPEGTLCTVLIVEDGHLVQCPSMPTTGPTWW